MKSMLALMAGAMVFTACSSDDEFENINEQKASSLKPMTFTASMEGHGDATRTAIDANGVSINWSTGDKIAIFDGVEDADHNFAREFTLAGGAGSTSGTFTGSAAEGAEVYYALYPNVVSKSESKTVSQEEAEAAAGRYYDEFEDWKRDIERSREERVIMYMEAYGISEENQAIILAYLKGVPATIKSGVQQDGSKFSEVILPAKQTVAEGQCVDPNAMLMIAKSTDASTLKFKNVCAYVKVTPKFDCSVITITSNGEENLAGTVTVDYNEGNPTTTVTANGSNSVYLMGSITAGNTYYIAVRPETLEKGFFVDFLTNDKTHYYQRSTSKSFTFDRSNVIKLGEFETGGTWTYHGVTSGNDGKGHNWVLVAPNVRLATTPLGVKIQGKDVNSHLSDWGTKWVVPLSTDLKGKLICTYDKNNSKATISGKGALRELPIVMQVNTSNTWCKDTSSESGTHYVISLTSGGIARVIYDDSDLYKHDIIYKYVGE